MADKTFRYPGDALTITYDLARCIHAAECVRGLPAVFDPDRTPWIDPDAADADAIAAVIHRCPTGALHYTRHDGGPPEPVPTRNTVRVVQGGPLFARGRLVLTTEQGETRLEETRMALCRCGASQNKPFCDNSHQHLDWDDAGTLGTSPLPEGPADADDADGEPLRITPATDGPLLLQGPVTLLSDDETTAVHGRKAALCRCGGSHNKPFCDGSHRTVGFRSDAAG
ncbi:MAG: hypothetical protein D6685_12105 [Bacteroidetes bacterium]|nr:MAG: hypothetical protein D6685_12105 [Bacteroidota bacterium]